MAFKCKIGSHSWNGCKCSECEKIRDEQHDWSHDCEKCSKCGTIRENMHDWSKDCDKCSKCDKICEHIWDGCKCSRCSKTRDENHFWEGNRCSKCKHIKDVDGNLYKTIRIGDQEWMTENLIVSTFRNGDDIPKVSSYLWNLACESQEPAWCYYNDDPKLMKLYNIYAVLDERGLAPLGWHISSDIDWQILNKFCDGDTNLSKLIETIYGWDKSEDIKSLGNKIFLSGYRGYIKAEKFIDSRLDTPYWDLNFWSLRFYDSAYELSLDNNYNKGIRINTFFRSSIGNLDFYKGFAVRCVKDCEIKQHDWDECFCKKCGMVRDRHLFYEDGLCTKCKTPDKEQRAKYLVKLIGNSTQHDWSRSKLKNAVELKKLSYQNSVLLVSELLESKSVVTRSHAAKTLNLLKDSKAVLPLLEFIKKQLPVEETPGYEYRDRENGIEALASLKDKRAIQPLISALEDNAINRSATYALKEFLDKELIEKLKMKIIFWEMQGLADQRPIVPILKLIFEFGDNSLTNFLFKIFTNFKKDGFTKQQNGNIILELINEYGDEKFVEPVSELLFDECAEDDKRIIYQFLNKFSYFQYNKPLKRNEEVKFLLEPALKEIEHNILHPNVDILYNVCIALARRIDFKDFSNSINSWGYLNIKNFYRLMHQFSETSEVNLNDRFMLLRSALLGRLLDVEDISSHARIAWKILQPSAIEETNILSDNYIFSSAHYLFDKLYTELLSPTWGRMPSGHKESLIQELCSWSFDKSVELNSILMELISKCPSASMHLVYHRLPEVLLLKNDGRDYGVEYSSSTVYQVGDALLGDSESLRILPSSI